MSHDDKAERLSFDQTTALMKEGKIPFAFNECVRSNQPLANLNGTVRCVLAYSTPHCITCPFDVGRLSRESQSDDENQTSEQEPPTGTQISFGAKIAEMNRDKQYI